MAESPKSIDGLGLEELKSLLVQVLEDFARLKAECADLREENARLKGLKGKPQIKPNLKPSGMEKSTPPEAGAKGQRKIGRRGSKRNKLTLTETKVVKAEDIPTGARLKGYEDFIVQDLIVQSKTVLYRRERWQLPDGTTVVAPLPAGISGHFGPELKRFVLAQYHQGQTTMPRLAALLADLGVIVSKRQLVRLLIDGQDAFLDEAADVLSVGPCYRVNGLLSNGAWRNSSGNASMPYPVTKANGIWRRANSAANPFTCRPPRLASRRAASTLSTSISFAARSIVRAGR